MNNLSIENINKIVEEITIISRRAVSEILYNKSEYLNLGILKICGRSLDMLRIASSYSTGNDAVDVKELVQYLTDILENGVCLEPEDTGMHIAAHKIMCILNQIGLEKSNI